MYIPSFADWAKWNKSFSAHSADISRNTDQPSLLGVAASLLNSCVGLNLQLFVFIEYCDF